MLRLDMFGGFDSDDCRRRVPHACDEGGLGLVKLRRWLRREFRIDWKISLSPMRKIFYTMNRRHWWCWSVSYLIGNLSSRLQALQTKFSNWSNNFHLYDTRYPRLTKGLIGNNGFKTVACQKSGHWSVWWDQTVGLCATARQPLGFCHLQSLLSLIQVLTQQEATGNRVDNNWKKVVWTACVEALVRSAGGAQSGEAVTGCKNRCVFGYLLYFMV
jgi:hypothetical protein